MEPWQTFVAIGIGGFGLGLGIVIGAFTARTLRKYMEAEKMLPYYEPRHRRPGDPE